MTGTGEKEETVQGQTLHCGELCGKTCCCYIMPEDPEAGVELLPGEEEVFPLEAGWHKPRFLPGSLYDYPPEWGRTGCIQVRCLEPCYRGAVSSGLEKSRNRSNPRQSKMSPKKSSQPNVKF